MMIVNKMNNLGFMSWRKLQVLVVTSVVSLMVAGCTSTGNAFNTMAVHQLVPGETTMADAVRILGADPVNTYRQYDGSATSIWARKNSMLTDAIYLNQELWLAFGPDGRFQRVVKKHNLPLNNNSTQQGNPSATVTPAKPVVVSSPQPVVSVGETAVPQAVQVSSPAPVGVLVPAAVATEPAAVAAPSQPSLGQPAVIYTVN